MLDGLRGLAAAMTFLRHMGDPLVNGWLHGVYLAVDMFFALSGFVLTHSYGDRLGRTIGVRQFAIARFIRFYPLYALGTAIGIVYFVIAGAEGADATTIGAAAVLAMLFLPVPPSLAFDSRRNLYPFNSSAWSLLMEYIVNLVFAFALPRLTNRGLAVLTTILLAMTAAAAVYARGLDVGWGYDWGGHPLLGILRAAASFTVGIVTYRIWQATQWRTTLPAWLPLILLLLLFEPTVYGGGRRALYDFTAAVLLFPALILLGAAIEPGPRWGSFMRTMGVASYPIYAIHSMLAYAMTSSLPDVYGPAADPTLRVVADIASLSALTVVAVLLDRHYDRPLRGLMTRWVENVRHRRQLIDREKAL